MPITYRLVRPQEEAALVELWTEVFPGTDRTRWQQQFAADPQRFLHTRVAVAADGTILASARYLPRHMHAADGQPLHMGWVTNVATKPTAQQQGHAGKLLALTIESMHQDGCQCSLLSADEEVAGFYEQYGWRRFPYRYRQGLLSGARLPTQQAYVCRFFDPRHQSDGWQQLATVYDNYNRVRPLTVVRDQAYWDTYIAMRYQDWATYAGAELLVVQRTPEHGQLSGYALVHFSPLGVLLSELCVQPDDEVAIADLLNTVSDELQRRNLPLQGRVHLPHEPAIDAALGQFFDQPLHEAHDAFLLVRPVGTSITEGELAALFAQPNAVFWLIDDY
jgi:predicted GNAT family N-acyltransferase